jgi:hypothetical protein
MTGLVMVSRAPSASHVTTRGPTELPPAIVHRVAVRQQLKTAFDARVAQGGASRIYFHDYEPNVARAQPPCAPADPAASPPAPPFRR